MPFSVTCPNCNVKLDIPQVLLGKKVRCASCSTIFDARLGSTTDPESTPREGEQDKPPLEPADERRPERPRHGLDDEDADDDYDRDDAEYDRPMRRDLRPHRSGLILGLGISSLIAGVIGLCCGLLSIIGIPLGAIAWIMGNADLRHIDRGEMDPDGRGPTKAGLICGIVGCGLGALGLLCMAAQIILQISMMNKRGF